MIFDLKAILKQAWTCCCILATLLTIVWQLYNFYNGAENTIIEYRRFNEMKTDVYPSIGLCWTMPINEEKLKQYGNDFTSEEYALFLAGQHWDERMLKVDYDRVTPNFPDYMYRYGYRYSSNSINDEELYDRDSSFRNKMTGLKEHSAIASKCFAINMPFVEGTQFNGFYMFFDSSIFGKEGRLANPVGDVSKENQFRVALHYPNQLIGKIDFGIRNWPIRTNSSPMSYLMRLTVGDIEVRVRRNTYHKPCIEGFPDYDEVVKESLLKRVGCKPPYLNSTPSYRPCKTQEELGDVAKLYINAIIRGNRRLEDMSIAKTPCRSLEMVRSDVQDNEMPDEWIKKYSWMNTSVGVILDFTEFIYKEVKSVRGMDEQALIGKFNLWTFFNYIEKAEAYLSI